MIKDKTSRGCCCCEKPIAACMGFVNAGDFVDAVEGKILFSEVRERCGKCVEIPEDKCNINLVKYQKGGGYRE